jgi:hypothetical protein
MKGGAYAVEALIVARYWMHKQVYFHKTRLACDHHLGNAMREILKTETGIEAFPPPGTPEQLQSFLEWDDFRVMGLLARGNGGEHGERLMTRNHYRLVCEIEHLDTSLSELNRSTRRAEEIVKALRTKVKDIERPKALWYKTKANDELILVDDENRRQIGYLSSFSVLMKSINAGSQVFVYADKADAGAAKVDYEKFLREEAEKTRAAEKVKIDAAPNLGSASQELADGAVPSTQLAFPPQGTGKMVQREVPTYKGVPNVG